MLSRRKNVAGLIKSAGWTLTIDRVTWITFRIDLPPPTPHLVDPVESCRQEESEKRCKVLKLLDNKKKQEKIHRAHFCSDKRRGSRWQRCFTVEETENSIGVFKNFPKKFQSIKIAEIHFFKLRIKRHGNTVRMKNGINLWKCSRIACQISRGTRTGINLQRIKSVCFHSSVARCQTENIGMRLAYFDKNFRLFLGLAAAAGTAVRAFDFGTTTPSRPKEKKSRKWWTHHRHERK